MLDNLKGHLNRYIPHQQLPNINTDAFEDIEQVFMKYLNTYKKESAYWVCDAAPGHGKTTVLKCLIKWMIDNDTRIPLLIVTKEISLAEVIYKEITQFKPGSIANVTSSNKEIIEKSLSQYQFVIIQQARLKNLALGYGNSYLYNHWNTYDRMIIHDEKPIFNNTSIFDVGDRNNCCDWFDELYKPLDDAEPTDIQFYRDTIINVVKDQLRNSRSGYTASVPLDSNIKDLIKLIKKMKHDKQNSYNFVMLQRLKHFEQLLTEDKTGRIDEYQVANRTGKKIMISEYINYQNFGLSTLILDGTCGETHAQYGGKWSVFELKHVANRNDYLKLNIHIREINTSNYSRSKSEHTTQQAIAKDIHKVKLIHNDLFILSTKSDKRVYEKLGIIADDDINLLNTTGKNVIQNRHSLYLTSLPKRHADYYKSICLAYHPDCDLSMNDDPKAANWFNDKNLEWMYRGELYAELIQIIHRTELRHINSKDPIDIYIAFDEDSKDFGSYTPTCININNRFMDGKALIDNKKLVDMSLYNRMDKVREFAEAVKINIDTYENIKLPCRVGVIDKTFQNWLKKHWKNQSEDINAILNEFQLEIYQDSNDHNNRKVRYIS